MGIFKREPAPKLVPGNLTTHMFAVFGIERPDAVCGFPDDRLEWITEEEDERRKEQARRDMWPSIEKDLQNPRTVAFYEEVLELSPPAGEDLAQRRERLATLMRPMFEVKLKLCEAARA